jgi:hypothetical protein
LCYLFSSTNSMIQWEITSIPSTAKQLRLTQLGTVNLLTFPISTCNGIQILSVCFHLHLPPSVGSYAAFLKWANDNCPAGLSPSSCDAGAAQTPYDYCKQELASVVLQFIKYCTCVLLSSSPCMAICFFGIVEFFVSMLLIYRN